MWHHEAQPGQLVHSPRVLLLLRSLMTPKQAIAHPLDHQPPAPRLTPRAFGNTGFEPSCVEIASQTLDGGS